jgi:hypothetical protein
MHTLTLTALLFILTISFNVRAQDEKAIRQATDEFMIAMTNWDNLQPYISSDYLKEKNLGDKKINLFMVEKYQIVKVDKALSTVEIDHGKGQFCTRIVLEFVSDKADGKLRILPPDEAADSKMINPWKSAEKLCAK